MDAFVTTMLERLLATSMQTAALASVVWLLCRCIPRLSPSTQCWLWWLVAMQALVGLLSSPVELPWLPSATSTTALSDPLQASGQTSLNADLSAAHSSRGESLFSAGEILLLIWMSGVAVMACVTLCRRLRTTQWLAGSELCDDNRTLKALAKALAASGLRSAPFLRISASIDSPLLVAQMRRPVLLLPSRVLNSDLELDMILAHELAHLRRRDFLWGLVPSLAQHLFFFNPFVHLAVREYAIDREAACDAIALDSCMHSRREYGRLLVNLGTWHGSSSGIAAASPTFHALKRRLTMLQHISHVKWGASTTLLLVVAAGVPPLRLVAAAASTQSAPTPSPRSSPAADALPRSSVSTRSPASQTEIKRTNAATQLPVGEAVQNVGTLRVNGQVQDLVKTGDKVVIRHEPEAKVAGQPEFTGARMSAAFESISTRTLLQLIGYEGGKKMTLSPSVSGNVTLSVNEVPWDQVLDLVLRLRGLEMRAQGNEIFVAPIGELAR